MNKEQKFYSALEDLFVGAKLEGKGGYVNLMNIKTDYFKKIKELIEKEVENNVNEDEKDELFDKLYTFFDSYLSDGGSIFFSSTPVYKNIYAKVYSDREDVALFWKTRNLYYVKTDVNYRSIKNMILKDEDVFSFDFDASEIEHKKANEKKELVFYFTGLERLQENKFVLKFKVKYKESTKYDRLKEILKINDTEKLRDYLQANLMKLDNPYIEVVKNSLDISVLNFKSKNKKEVKAEFLIEENNEDLFGKITIEPVITDIQEIVKYCKKKGLLIISEDDILKAFRIYKRQNEIDYFIHKDACKFLKEQFDLYIYQYLANDLDTIFNQERLNTLRKIKKIAYYVIDLIGRFEDELKKMWLKPKFVRKSNYVITLDRIVSKDGGMELVREIFRSNGIEKQIQEWIELGIVDENFKKEDVFVNGMFEELNEKYKHLPIDTKYFGEEIKYEILSLFENLDDELDGWLIKSENFQALNTILPKFRNKVQTIYIDPPFNTGKDFEYIDRFQDSTWLTLMENRLEMAKELLKEDGGLFLHLDYNANFYGRILLNQVFTSDGFVNEIIWRIGWVSGYKTQVDAFVRNHDTIYFYSPSGKRGFFRKDLAKIPYKSFKKDTIKDEIKSIISKWGIKAADLRNIRITFLCNSGKVYKVGLETKEGTYNVEDTWNCNEYEELNSNKIKRNAKEYTPNGSEITQKPEELLKRIFLLTTKEKDLVLDFFAGSGTSLAVAHKLGRKWIGIEIEHYFESDIIWRMKHVLKGVSVHEPCGISKDVNWQGGGFFKYYELEQFEDTLRKAVYKPKNDKIENIEFDLDLKLAKDGLEIDYEGESARYTFEKLYHDVDIPETISNLIGKKIKKITKDKVIYEGDFEVDLNNLTFEKYPFLKSLIWWE